jgi:rubredoxin
MGQKGAHTWDLYLHYHRCPFCGLILESREDFHYILGQYKKDLECPRCKHSFTLVKNVQPALGPLIGEPQPPDIDWSE